MSFVLIGFGDGLQGEEIPLVSLGGMLHFWDETSSDPDPFIMVTLYGRFKGETGCKWHCLPICDHNWSSIPFQEWIGWMLRRRVMIKQRVSGWLFRRVNRWVRISNFDEIHTLYPSLFSVGTLLDLFSTWRSMRQGAVLETKGQVDKAIVTLMNCWRTKEGTRKSAPGLTM